MTFKNLLGLALALALMIPAQAAPVLRVVTTTTDLAAIAQAVGGELVEVQSLAKGYSDLHFYEPRPSDVVKIRQADVFARMGLELDTVWSQPLVDAARNARLVQVDCSQGIPVLEKPTGPVNPSMGDVHPDGNPHYQMDPANGKIIAQTLAEAFGRAAPQQASAFERRREAFDAQLDRKLEAWQSRMAAVRGAKVIDYHKELTYFANRFGLTIVGTIEPKPGVPPTPSHTEALMRLIKEQRVKAVVVEPWYNLSTPRLLQRSVGVPFVVIPTSVGAEPDLRTYFDLFDRIVAKLEAVLK